MISHDQIPIHYRDPQSQLESLIGDGFKRVEGEVESALYEWQTDQHSKMLGEVITHDDLGEEFQPGLEAIKSLLVAIGLEAGILEKRLKRLGFFYVDPVALIDLGEEGMGASGAYDMHNALVVADKTQAGAWGKHVILHEVVHGLSQSQSAFTHQGTIRVSGNGLFVARAHNGDNLKAVNPQLARLNEALVDMIALVGSGMPMSDYDNTSGYARDVQRLRNTNEVEPNAVYASMQACFVTGIESETHANELISRSRLF